MENKLEKLGYNKWLQRGTPPPSEMLEDEFSLRFPQVTASNVKGNVSKENIQKAFEDLTQLSGLQSGASLSISLTNGQQATLTSTIDDNINPNRRMLGVVEITAYEDTPGSGLKRIPEIRSLSDYSIYSGYDYHDNELSSVAKKGLTFFYSIVNNSGSTHTIWFVFRWRYLGSVATLDL